MVYKDLEQISPARRVVTPLFTRGYAQASKILPIVKVVVIPITSVILICSPSTGSHSGIVIAVHEIIVIVIVTIILVVYDIIIVSVIGIESWVRMAHVISPQRLLKGKERKRKAK